MKNTKSKQQSPRRTLTAFASLQIPPGLLSRREAIKDQPIGCPAKGRSPASLGPDTKIA